MTTEDLPGGSRPGTGHPAGVVPQPPQVRDEEVTGLSRPEFPVALRGYDRDAVDAYVDQVNRVVADLQASRSPQAAIRNALDQVGEETSGILERAHETADEITGRSRSQAEERLQKAEEEARETVRAAETRLRMLDTDAEEIWQERKRLIDDVQRVADDLTELAESAARRFPPETPDSGADTLAIEPDSGTAQLPPPPPQADEAGADDEREKGDTAA
jgi:cell division initiation protein